jgi:hypothetical protein
MTPSDLERITKRIAFEAKSGARMFSLKTEDAAWLVANVGEMAWLGKA